MAALAVLLDSIGGCAFFKADNWNPNNYRDERAIDIDKRLDRGEPIVKNPF